MNDTRDLQPVPRGPQQSGLKQFAMKFCVSVTLAVGFLAAVECVSYLLLPHRRLPLSEYKAYVVWEKSRSNLAGATL